VHFGTECRFRSQKRKLKKRIFDIYSPYWLSILHNLPGKWRSKFAIVACINHKLMMLGGNKNASKWFAYVNCPRPRFRLVLCDKMRFDQKRRTACLRSHARIASQAEPSMQSNSRRREFAAGPATAFEGHPGDTSASNETRLVRLPVAQCGSLGCCMRRDLLELARPGANESCSCSAIHGSER